DGWPCSPDRPCNTLTNMPCSPDRPATVMTRPAPVWSFNSSDARRRNIVIRYKCPACAIPLQAPDTHGGKKAHCPKCNQKLQIPVPPPPLNKTILAPLDDELSQFGVQAQPVESAPNRPAPRLETPPVAIPVPPPLP